jgi:peptidoglycan/LPS O-acetylase OafA/YrhL
LDGLRGLAAIAVASLHILADPVRAVSVPAGEVVFRGKWGVFVFFVISGFVITHSLHRVTMTPGTLGRFLARRVVRLDPPYWASMVLVYVIASGASFVLPEHPVVLPSPGAIAAHLLYLQYILRIPSISDVYWTLCLEIQFYLVLAVSLGVYQRLQRWLSSGRALALVFLPTLVGSFLVAIHVLPSPIGSCFEYWYAFVAGAAAQRLVSGHGWAALATAVTVALLVAVITRKGEGVVIALTALAIGAAHASGNMNWLSGRAWQYLGRISYSLYLVHIPIGGRVSNLLAHLPHGNPAMRVAEGLIGMGAAVVGADLFWRLVERPSVDLSHRVFTGSREAVGPAPSLAAPPQ